MSVRKRTWKGADGRLKEYWMVHIRYRYPDGREQVVRRKSPVQTRRGAERFEREVRAALQAGTYGKERSTEVPTLEEFTVEFMRDYATSNNKPSEVSTKEGHFKNHLLPAFGTKRLTEIDSRAIEKFKAGQKAAGLSNKAINNQLSTLRKTLGIAVEWKLLEVVPKVQPLKVQPQPFDFFDFGEAKRLLDAAENQAEPWHAMITIALNTGLRWGELTALSWADVDLKNRRLTVSRNQWRGQIGTPKSGRQRIVALNSVACAALEAIHHRRSEIVFCREDGKMLTQRTCARALERACKAAGLRQLGWHALRHTFASHLVMKGVSLKVVQEALGHVSMDMTLRYAHLTPSAKHDALEVLAQPVAS